MKTASRTDTSSSVQPASLTVFRNTQGLMTKEIALGEDGKIVKKPACALYEGHARRVEVSSLDELKHLILNLDQSEALGYGVCDPAQAPVVTQAKVDRAAGSIARSRDYFKFSEGPGVMMFDYDPVDIPLGPDAVVSALQQALPELKHVNYMQRPSASSCIVDSTTGRQLVGVAGMRFWILVDNASRIPAIGELLCTRLWAQGHATVVISKSGAILDRPLFDAAVWQPERLDFVAGAVCQHPLTQDRPDPAIVNRGNGVLDTHSMTPATSADLAGAAKNREAARKRLEPEARRIRSIYVQNRSEEFAKALNVTPEVAAQSLRRAIETNELGPDFVLYPEYGDAVSVANVLATPERYDNTRFADPVEPGYNNDSRIAWVCLSSPTPFLWSHAHGGMKYELSGQPDGQPSHIELLNKTYGLVQIGKSMYVSTQSDEVAPGQREIKLMTSEAFKLVMRNQPHPENKRGGTLGTYWLEHPNRRDFVGMEFNPARTTPGYLNMFSGWTVSPKAGRTERFWEHVHSNICNRNDQAYRYLRAWFAHIFQKPTTIPGTSLVLRGPQGAGKNTLVDALGHLLGRHYITLHSMDQLTGRFNSHLAYAMLVFANEAIWGGIKGQAGKLKALITDKEIPVEQKGVDIYMIPNFRRLVVASNEAWAVPAENDDRRFVFLDVSGARANDHAYFAAIHKELNAGGYEGLMYDLLSEDLTSFTPMSKPDTGFGFDVKIQSACSFDRWLYQVLHEGALSLNDSPAFDFPVSWEGDIEKREFFYAYKVYCRTRSERNVDELVTFHKHLKAAIPSLLPSRPTQRRAPAGRGVVPPIRLAIEKSESSAYRQRLYSVPSLEDARREFERHMHSVGQIEWPTVDRPLTPVQVGQAGLGSTAAA